MRPHMTYLIYSTKRSGSFLLCEALWNTGLAGRPKEYFTPLESLFLADEVDIAAYLGTVFEQGTTPNGVCGAKLIWEDIDVFLEKARQTPRYRQMATAAILQDLLPNLHHIRITRRDKVRQAISALRAYQTGAWIWFDGDAPITVAEPVFDFEAIEMLIETIKGHEMSLQQYFLEAGITPFDVVYEDLAHAYEATAVRVLQHLRITIPEPLVFGSRRMKRQSDALSEDWVRRYHALKGV